MASRRARSDVFPTVAQWQKLLRARPASLNSSLAEIYGRRSPMIAERVAKLSAMLEDFAGAFGADRSVVIARAPGRVNLMGRHIDHRGGYCNLVAIPNDVWVVASARTDGRILLRNLDAEFPPCDIGPADLESASRGGSWHDFVESETVGTWLKATRGAWGNYPLGAWLRLRREFGAAVPAGFSGVFWGDVPRSVGLSSSSSLFVATAMALLRLGDIEIERTRFVDLCGQGEWFVGTRGGAGDHAAMIYGRRTMVSQIGFFPIHLADQAPLSDDIEIILCNSGQKAQKSKGARDRFNARVAAYEIGLAVLKQRWPRLTARVEHLRDINPEFLGVGVERIYQALKTIPLWMTRKEVSCTLPEQIEEIETWFSTHGDCDGGYPLRAVLLFGIAECERARQALHAIGSGHRERIRRLFRVSHDGDRVSRPGPAGRRVPWAAEYDDDYFDRLIRHAQSSHPDEREQAALYNQPGAYGCSTPEIDEMVDIAMETEGVIGAQLVGAGLGGSIVALAEKGAADRLRDSLERGYYAPRRIPPAVHVFQPAEGVGCLKFEG
ncbi:MAG: hypothetical protein N3D11_10260 [Candidatus Sumerlaeia bacterium]|nr:hypothetical protein [Candidatus Sumerlaeia bacterium]